MKMTEMEGPWEAGPEAVKSGLPVDDETYIRNVRANCLMDLPNLEVTRDHDKIMVMVCGGPTAKMHLEEIRKKRADDRYVIFTSNQTHDWLISEGIVPHYQFIIDPKKSKLDDVKHPHKDVKYILGISCDNEVFQALAGYDVTRTFSVSGTGTPSDVQVIQALFPYQEITYLFGGTMAGLRAMSLADVMGFLTMEYYGFDSCYFDTEEDGSPIYYSYDKKRKENILEVETSDGRMFLTSPVFASQANQFLKWRKRYEWINFVIHGNSFTAALLEIEEAKEKRQHNLLITDYHKALNKQLHTKAQHEERTKKPAFGHSGHFYAGQVSVLIGEMVKKCGEITVLDYGCGKRTLEETLPPILGMKLANYDPCIDGLDGTPEPADLVVCTDVLEHVEPECLENVLDDLQRVTKQALFLAVSTRLAHKSTSDGQNTHKIVQEQDWWRPKLRKRFDIVQVVVVPGDKFTAILQAKEVGR